MALAFSDGFSLYSDLSGATLLKGWTGSTGSSDVAFRNTGRWGANSYSLYIDVTGSSRGRLSRSLSMSGSTTIVGFAMQTSVASTTTNSPFLTLTNGTATVALTWVTGNKVSITDGGATTFYTIPSSLATNTWYYLELKIVWNASGGQIVFRMDTSQYYDSGATLALGSSTNATSLTLGSTVASTFSVRTTYADLMLMDGTSTRLNDFQGDVRIETLLPNSDGTHGAWAVAGNTLLTSVNQARFATDTSGWAILTGTPSFTRTATDGPKNSIPTYANLSGTGSIISTPNGTGGYPVTAGQTLRIGAYMRGSTSFSLQAYLRFYDSSGAVVGSDVNTGALNSTFSSSVWVWSTTSLATVPAGATTCAIILSPNSSSRFSGVTLSVVSGSANYGYVDPSGAHVHATSDWINDGDSSYVHTNTVGAKDTYAMSQLQATTGNVLGVGTYVVARKETASTHTISAVTRIGGVDYSTTPTSLPDNLTYQTISTFYPANPATNSSWTRAEVNSLEAGIDLPS